MNNLFKSITIDQKNYLMKYSNILQSEINQK